MAIGYNDEFAYLEDESNAIETEEPFVPKMKGESSLPLAPENDIDEEAEKKAEEEAKKKAEEEALKPKREFESQIYIVKVTTNKEDKAIEMIVDKVNKKEIDVYSVARPHGLRGYVFLESPDRKHAEDAVFNLPYIKGIIGETVTYDKVKQMLEPVAEDIKIEKNDIIEIISEPFKNEKAKVVRVDKPKNECVVSLLGAAVPIPVTVKLDNIRVIRRDEE